MKETLIKFLKKRRKDFLAILLYITIIWLTWIIIQRIPILKRDSEKIQYIHPIKVTVEDVKQEIVSESTVKDTELDVIYDTISFYLPDGQYHEITLSHLSEDYRIKKGDHIIVYTFDDQTYYYHDMNRVYYMKYLLLLFIILIVIIGGVIGIKSLFSLFFSCLILIFALIPLLEKGYNPIFVISAIGFLVISSSLFFTFGFKKRSLIALFGTMIGLSLSVGISLLYVDLLRLTGIQDEIDSFLLNNSTTDFNMKYLLIGSFILGTLGIIDDVTISQVVTVEEIHKNSKNLTIKELFLSAMKVGRTHIASMVNTLFLAYFSVSLSLILVVSMQDWDMNLLLNRRFIATEVVRTLIGSVGLVISVPITTYLACLLSKHNSIRKIIGGIKRR